MPVLLVCVADICYGSPARRRAAVDAGAVDAVAAALREHGRYLEIQQAGMWALARLGAEPAALPPECLPPLRRAALRAEFQLAPALAARLPPP